MVKEVSGSMSEEDESVCPTCHGRGKISPKQLEHIKTMGEEMDKLVDTVRGLVRDERYKSYGL